MLIKVCELKGIALDWAVAKCNGWDNLRKNPHRYANFLIMSKHNENIRLEDYSPSTNWSQGGPIIERERILLRPIRKDSHLMDGQWLAMYNNGNTGSMVQWVKQTNWKHHYLSGPTPLIAAMRCYVASKLGDTVDIPEELLK